MWVCAKHCLNMLFLALYLNPHIYRNILRFNYLLKKDFYSAIHSMDKLSVEPEKIKRWREEQKIRLETKGKVITIKSNII